MTKVTKQKTFEKFQDFTTKVFRRNTLTMNANFCIWIIMFKETE